MAKIVVIGGHPDYKASIANRSVLEEFHKLVPSAEIVRLSELYPTFQIDAAIEQGRLIPAEMIIFDYPFWWYGAPSLLHRYIEQVFTHGWAYGTNGQKLKDKNLVLSFTTGAPENEYQRLSGIKNTIEEFLPGMIATARFTGMIYRGAVYSYDMACYDPTDSARIKDVRTRGQEQAKRLKDHIAQFVILD